MSKIKAFENEIDELYSERRSLYGSTDPVSPSDLNTDKQYRVDASPSEILYSYFIFLCDLVGLNNELQSASEDHSDTTYFHLAQKLHSIDFYGGVPNDINRGEDGKRLRVLFSQTWSNFKDYSVLNKPRASVLEMLIALADRIDISIMRGPDEPDRSEEWFWLMLNNLHITKEDFVDSKWDETKDKFVNSVIEKMLARNYDSNGDGSLFPDFWGDNDRTENLKDVEIWYQMQYWFRKYRKSLKIG